MLYVGLDFSRKRLQWSAFDELGAEAARGVVVPEPEGLSDLVERAGRHGAPVLAAIESMTGSRFVHDQLELRGWDVRIADAQRVKGAGAACLQDRPDRRARARRARMARSDPGDLAAGSGGTGRARTGTFPVAPGQAPHGAEVAYPSDAGRARCPLTGQRPFRGRWPPAAARAGAARAVAEQRRGQPHPDRPANRGDRRLRGRAASPQREPSARDASDPTEGPRLRCATGASSHHA